MDLFERLALLQTTGQISESTYLHMERTLLELRDRWKIPLEDDGMVMFVTHLALACTQVEHQGIVAPLDSALLTEVQNSVFRRAGEAILDRIEVLLGVCFPEAESGYLLLHLCNILERMEAQK